MKINKKMQNTDLKFDLFKLHVPEEDKNSGKSWIRVKSNKLLCQQLKNMINVIVKRYPSQNELGRELGKILKCDPTAPLRYIISIKKDREKWIPLIFIESILHLYTKITNENFNELRDDIQRFFEILKVGNGASKSIMALRELNEPLCKIAGAHAADGHLGDGALYVLVEEYKTSVESFRNWLKQCFDISPRIFYNKQGNTWNIEFRNKILGRYLNIYLGFPYGSKTENVSEPNIIKYVPLDFRKSFALGVMTFDGSVSPQGRVRLELKSKSLRDSIVEILKLDQLNITTSRNKERGHWSFSTNQTFTKEEKEKWLCYFEKYTEKWNRLNESFFGYKARVDTIEKAITILDKKYKNNNSKLYFKDLIYLIKKMQIFDLNSLLKELDKLKINYNASVIFRHLQLLKKANILSITNIDSLPLADLINMGYVDKSAIYFALNNVLKNKIRRVDKKEFIGNMNISDRTRRHWLKDERKVSFHKIMILFDLFKIERNSPMFYERLKYNSNSHIYIFNEEVKEWFVPSI